MKQLVITALTLIFGLSSTTASKGAPEIEAAFDCLRQDRKIELKLEDQALSLHSLLEAEDHSIIQALYVLQEIKNGNMKADLPHLNMLLKEHKAMTFKSRYPKEWRFISAKDYHSMLCQEIEAVIDLKKEEKNDDK